MGNLFIVFSLLLMLAGRIFSSRSLKISKRDFKLFLWCCIFAIYAYSSRLWAQRASLTVSKSNALIFIVIAMGIILTCKYEGLSVDDILKVLMYGGYTVGIFVLFRYGFRGILAALQNEQRLGQVLNANTLGMCVAYSLLINFYYLLYGKRFAISDLLIIPTLVILVATGSRKSIVILIGGVFLLFIIKNYNNKRAIQSLANIVLIIVLLSIITFFALKLPALSRISSRLKSMIIVLLGGGTRSTDGWLRVQYVKLGIQLFRQHPVLGIGLGNANIYTSMYWGHNHYLHNNYVELLATLGIVGTLLYYGIFIYFLKIFWKYRKTERDKNYDICIVILILKLIMDYGAVFFYNRETYIFILLFWIETSKLKSGQHRRMSISNVN